jgi:hypothetical protein
MRPGRDPEPSHPSSAEIKNRIELYLYCPFVAYDRVKPTYSVFSCQGYYTIATYSFINLPPTIYYLIEGVIS